MRTINRFSVENVDGRPLQRSLTPAVFSAEEVGQLGAAFEVSYGISIIQFV